MAGSRSLCKTVKHITVFVALSLLINSCLPPLFFIFCRDQILEMFDHAYGSYMVRSYLV